MQEEVIDLIPRDPLKTPHEKLLGGQSPHPDIAEDASLLQAHFNRPEKLIGTGELTDELIAQVHNARAGERYFRLGGFISRALGIKEQLVVQYAPLAANGNTTVDPIVGRLSAEGDFVADPSLTERLYALHQTMGTKFYRR